MNLDNFTKLLVNGRASKECAMATLELHGYTATFLACTQRILDAMNTPTMHKHLKQFPNTSLEIVLREIFSQLLLRMAPLFHAHGSIEVGEEEFHTFYRQQLSASEKTRELYALTNPFMYYSFLHAQFNSKDHLKPESPLFSLSYVFENISKNRRILGNSGAAPEEVLAILLTFAPEYMSCDERWLYLEEAAQAVGLNLFLTATINDVRRTLAGDLPATLPMCIQSPVIASFVQNTKRLETGTPFAVCDVEDTTVSFRLDPELPMKLMQYQKDTAGKTGMDYVRQRFAFPTQAYSPAGALPWIEPWTWPGLEFASAPTKVALFVWMLSDYHHPQYAQRTADAIGLPWELLNDKSPAQWASINPRELMARLESMLQPLHPTAQMPVFDWEPEV